MKRISISESVPQILQDPEAKEAEFTTRSGEREFLPIVKKFSNKKSVTLTEKNGESSFRKLERALDEKRQLKGKDVPSLDYTLRGFIDHLIDHLPIKFKIHLKGSLVRDLIFDDERLEASDVDLSLHMEMEDPEADFLSIKSALASFVSNDQSLKPKEKKKLLNKYFPHKKMVGQSYNPEHKDNFYIVFLTGIDLVFVNRTYRSYIFHSDAGYLDLTDYFEQGKKELSLSSQTTLGSMVFCLANRIIDSERHHTLSGSRPFLELVREVTRGKSLFNSEILSDFFFSFSRSFNEKTTEKYILDHLRSKNQAYLFIINLLHMIPSDSREIQTYLLRTLKKMLKSKLEEEQIPHLIYLWMIETIFSQGCDPFEEYFESNAWIAPFRLNDGYLQLHWDIAKTLHETTAFLLNLDQLEQDAFFEEVKSLHDALQTKGFGHYFSLIQGGIETWLLHLRKFPDDHASYLLSTCQMLLCSGKAKGVEALIKRLATNYRVKRVGQLLHLVKRYNTKFNLFPSLQLPVYDEVAASLTIFGAKRFVQLDLHPIELLKLLPLSSPYDERMAELFDQVEETLSKAGENEKTVALLQKYRKGNSPFYRLILDVHETDVWLSFAAKLESLNPKGDLRVMQKCQKLGIILDAKYLEKRMPSLLSSGSLKLIEWAVSHLGLKQLSRDQLIRIWERCVEQRNIPLGKQIYECLDPKPEIPEFLLPKKHVDHFRSFVQSVLKKATIEIGDLLFLYQSVEEKKILGDKQFPELIKKLNEQLFSFLKKDDDVLSQKLSFYLIQKPDFFNEDERESLIQQILKKMGGYDQEIMCDLLLCSYKFSSFESVKKKLVPFIAAAKPTKKYFVLFDETVRQASDDLDTLLSLGRILLKRDNPFDKNKKIRETRFFALIEKLMQYNVRDVTHLVAKLLLQLTKAGVQRGCARRKKQKKYQPSTETLLEKLFYLRNMEGAEELKSFEGEVWARSKKVESPWLTEGQYLTSIQQTIFMTINSQRVDVYTRYLKFLFEVQSDPVSFLKELTVRIVPRGFSNSQYLKILGVELNTFLKQIKIAIPENLYFGLLEVLSKLYLLSVEHYQHDLWLRYCMVKLWTLVPYQTEKSLRLISIPFKYLCVVSEDRCDPYYCVLAFQYFLAQKKHDRLEKISQSTALLRKSILATCQNLKEGETLLHYFILLNCAGMYGILSDDEVNTLKEKLLADRLSNPDSLTFEEQSVTYLFQWVLAKENEDVYFFFLRDHLLSKHLNLSEGKRKILSFGLASFDFQVSNETRQVIQNLCPAFSQSEHFPSAVIEVVHAAFSKFQPTICNFSYLQLVSSANDDGQDQRAPESKEDGH